MEDVVPTIGFSNYDIELAPSNNTNNNESTKKETPQQQHRIVLYDLGGGRRIRSIWKNYYALVHGIMFVIDSTSMDHIEQVQQLLEEVLSNEKVMGKPVLM